MIHLWCRGIKDVSCVAFCRFCQRLAHWRWREVPQSLVASRSAVKGWQCHSNFLHQHKIWDGKKKIPRAAGLRNPMSGVYKCPVAQDWPRKHMWEWAFSCLWGMHVFKALLLAFRLLFSTELVKTKFDDMFVKILSQWTPSPPKFCDTSSE